MTMRHVYLLSEIPLALLVGGFAIGCQNPDLKTNLNTEGAPEVTTVLVLSEAREVDFNRDGFPDCDPSALEFCEAATFCGQRVDFKVHRGFCPRNTEGAIMAAEPVMDAAPASWFARVVFSELLNPDVEELVDANLDGKFEAGTIKNTQPVSLTCNGQVVAYDGFYDPSGNDVTQRPGPALVIQPLVQVATNARCELSVNSTVTDKEGFGVDPAFAGPFVFGLAPMSVVATSPENNAEGIGLDATLSVDFNAEVLKGSLTDATLTLVDNNGNAVALTREAKGTSAELKPAAPLNPGTSYTLTIAPTGIRDTGGGELTLAAPKTITFQTQAAAPAPTDGE